MTTTVPTQSVLVFSDSVQKQLAELQGFYKKTLSLDTDLSTVRIPLYVPGFDRLIVIPQWLRMNQVWEVYKARFRCRTDMEDLDSAVTVLERNSMDCGYAIWTRDTPDPHPEMLFIDAYDIKVRKLKTMTVLERLVFGLKYFEETGKHLDTEGVTLCTGSRKPKGAVPRMHLSNTGRIIIYNANRQSRPSVTRARLVID